MRHRAIVKLGLAVATVAATVLPAALFAGPAFADYAPTRKDVVGVGSDTLQYMIDFLADGDAYGDPGYNVAWQQVPAGQLRRDRRRQRAPGLRRRRWPGQPRRLARPAPGRTAGTGNSGTTNTGVPCVLNPTIVLRAGLQPVQRPNGSGAGFTALVQDIVAGDNASTAAQRDQGRGDQLPRASSSQSTTATCRAAKCIDQLSVATDTLPMIKTTTPVSNAVPLSAAQLDTHLHRQHGQLRQAGTTRGSVGPRPTRSSRSSRRSARAPAATSSSTIGDSLTHRRHLRRGREENDPTALAASNQPGRRH